MNPYESNKIFKQTFEDMKSIQSDKHPKALYTECLSNNAYWRHFTAADSLSVDDLAMVLCKNVGCDLNYCGLIKKSYSSDWKGSSDWSDEYKAFTDWMTRERRNWQWGEHDMSMYDYIWQKLEKQKIERKHKPLIDVKIPDEDLPIESEIDETKRQMKESYM